MVHVPIITVHVTCKFDYSDCTEFRKIFEATFLAPRALSLFALIGVRPVDLFRSHVLV